MSPKVREIIKRTRAEIVSAMSDEINAANIGVLQSLDSLILIDATQGHNVNPAAMTVYPNGCPGEPEDRSDADSAIIKGLQGKLEDLKRENQELRGKLTQHPRPKTQDP